MPLDSPAPDTAAPAPPAAPALRSARSRPAPRWKRLLAGGLLAPLVLVGALNAWVLGEARGRLHEPAGRDMPAVPIAMVLGTSPRRPDGMPNRHFQRRLDAAAALHAAGKVRTLVVSGATDGKYYDEPRDMRAGLIARGVPESAVVEDRRGVRTFDSVLRLKDDFHATRCAIISDAWHVPRALFIADRIGLDAVGVRAQPVPLRHSFKSRAREWLARVLVVLDMYVLETKLQPQPAGREPALR